MSIAPGQQRESSQRTAVIVVSSSLPDSSGRREYVECDSSSQFMSDPSLPGFMCCHECVANTEYWMVTAVVTRCLPKDAVGCG